MRRYWSVLVASLVLLVLMPLLLALVIKYCRAVAQAYVTHARGAHLVLTWVHT